MKAEEFAARRRAQFVKVDDELLPSVRDALQAYLNGRANWHAALIDDASVIWLEIFQSEAPNADPDRFMPRFREALGEDLAQTKRPEGMVTEAQINRVVMWLGTYIVNDATLHGVGARGGRFKRWVTMHDASVRPEHRALDGQIVPVGATFNLGGHDLRFPGDPVGPPDLWINCRCVLQPAGRVGEANMTATTFEIADATYADGSKPPLDEDGIPILEDRSDEDPDDMVDEPEDDEDLITEIPVHGVLAPEGVKTGDGRMFGENALTNRDLPLPIQYQTLSTEGHGNSVTVGRIDEVFRHGNELRFRGAIVLTKEYSPTVIEGIVDGTVRGVSVDVDDIEIDMSAVEESDLESGTMQTTVFSKARVAGVTIVAIPAFQEAYIALGEDFEGELEEGELTPEDALAACGCPKGPEDDDNPDVELGYDAFGLFVGFRDYTAEQRRDMAKKGEALPDGSFPIKDEEDLKNAIQAIGRASDPAKAKAHIKRRARALGKTDLIPTGWSVNIADLTGLTGEELAYYESLDPYEQDIWLMERHSEAILAGAFAPGTKDGPGWITHPIPTARIRRYWVRGKGAAKIRWGVGGDFNRCRRQLAKYVRRPDWLAGLCANMHKEALGYWPATHRKMLRGHALLADAKPAPMFTLVASTYAVLDHTLFERPKMDNPRVGVRVEGDHVYGYIAQWGVCHIGISGVCTEAPTSRSDYWYYATGVVDTDEGEVRVGQITMDTGHAPLRANAKVAAAHYDNTGAVVADVAVGEDEFGIWFSGAIRPNVSDEKRHALKASGRLSGDWRLIGRDLELVAALAVNVPGFPIPHTRAGVYSGQQVSLVAAGLTPPDDPAVTHSSETAFNADTIAAIARTAVQEYRHQEARAKKIEPLRAQVRQRSVEALRAKLKGN